MGERIAERFATVCGYAFRSIVTTFHYFIEHTPQTAPPIIVYFRQGLARAGEKTGLALSQQEPAAIAS